MDIPLVIIAYETHTFIKQFVEQATKYFNKIIIIDNNSQYPVLLDYYNQLEASDPNKFTIHRLPVNHGHIIYQKNIVPLPPVYCLSDPDIEFNKALPANFLAELYRLSTTYHAYKVGFALEMDVENFIKDDTFRAKIKQAESGFWTTVVETLNGTDPVYTGLIDTTFCLVNTNNKSRGYLGPGLRVAGNYTSKHLPWYDGYIKNNMPLEEFNYWKQKNKSSTILQHDISKFTPGSS